jgi:pimeloyl-ACP methyl ester carboxylesterase
LSIHSVSVGEGPVDVVFLHGLFGQGKNFQTIAKAIGDLATSRLVDLPNHGESSWTEEFDYDEHASLVAEWLRANFDHPVVLVGHSMGGKIAMRLALQHPELVRALVVVDISPDRNETALGFTSLVSGLRSLDLENVVSRSYADHQLAERIPEDAVRRFLLQNLQRGADHWRWRANLDLLGDELHAISGWKPIEGSYEGPTLWVVGGKSDYVKPEHEGPMREHFPAVRSITLKRAGHWVHSEDPESFIEILRMLIEQLPAA